MATRKTTKKNEPQRVYIILEKYKKWFGLSHDLAVYFVTDDKGYAEDIVSSKIELGDDVYAIEVPVHPRPVLAKKPRAKRAS